MDKKEWKIPYARPEIPAALLKAGYGPLLSAVLALRGIRTAAEAHGLIEGGMECLHDPFLILGMDTAVARIRMAVDHRETVAVYGDYDVDGITSTCLLTDYLRSKGLHCLSYIPDRNEEGYGLNCAALDALKAQGVSLVITVDCGITAVAETDYARSLGLDMIITDHHECKNDGLPDAVSVVDCKQPGDSYPNDKLAGVGMALKLACACEGSSAAMLDRYADLVAVGTVADVMPLTEENRYLVRRGLAMLAQRPRPGFAAMLKEASLDPQRLTAASIGFGLAPRLNAAGRLGQTGKALDLLMCGSPEQAAPLAAELCELNRQRQNIEMEIWEEAQTLLPDIVPDQPIVLASDNWHQGVIGIAASRLAEQFSVPAIMICLNGELGKGSCRSYGNFNLFEALDACSDQLIDFGGHALAAGLNVRRDKVEDFRRALSAYYRSNRPEPQPEVQCDLLIRDPSMLSIESVQQLDLLEPYGNGNPRPILCLSGVEVLSACNVGGGRHLRLRVRLGQSSFEGIFFSHTAEELDIHEGDRIDLAFNPKINEFRGHVSVQLQVVAARKHEAAPLCRDILEQHSDCLWAAADACPCRADFVRIWRESKGRIHVGSDAQSILDQRPAGMLPETYCICLIALMEAGLLSGPDGGIFGAVAVDIQGKADLEATSILRALRSMPRS